MLSQIRRLKLTPKLLLAIISSVIIAFIITLYTTYLIFERSSINLSQEIAMSLESEEAKIQKSLENQLYAKADTIGRFMAQTAAEMMYSNNYIDLLTNQKQATVDDDVIYALYLDKEGKPIASPYGLPTPSSTVITRQYPIIAYDQVIGYVLIGIGTHNLQSRYLAGTQHTKQLLTRIEDHFGITLNNLMISIGVVVFFLLVILSVGIVVFFNREVIGRLRETQQMITKLRSRNADHKYRLPVVYNDEISELRHEVNMLTDDLLLMLDELKNAQNELVESEKMAALGSLVAGVSHEINTPVGIAVTASTYLNEQTRQLQKAVDEQQLKRSSLDHYLHDANESSEIILSNLQRAATLIQSFKQVAVQQNTDDTGTIELDDFVENIVYSLRPSFRKTKISIEENIPAGISLHTYPGSLSQVLTNLLMNAQKHAFADNQPGVIKINAQEADNAVIIDVSDNGTGVDEEHKSKLFEPFFTTKRGQGGSGLGLNIVYNLVTQKLNGRIRVYDVKPHGLGFEITLYTIE